MSSSRPESANSLKCASELNKTECILCQMASPKFRRSSGINVLCMAPTNPGNLRAWRHKDMARFCTIPPSPPSSEFLLQPPLLSVKIMFSSVIFISSLVWGVNHFENSPLDAASKKGLGWGVDIAGAISVSCVTLQNVPCASAKAKAKAPPIECPTT